jgi:hypothetical protein
MHANQHAFQKDRSTKLSLSDTVDNLESKVLRGGFAIGIFLYIEGAFNNILPEGILESLGKRGMVLAAMLNLDTLAEKQVVSLWWVRAHVGFTGNEKADFLAKKGSQMVSMAPEPLVSLCQLT